jgi:hypothetical protein
MPPATNSNHVSSRPTLRPGADTDHGTGVAADAWPITALLFLEARDLAETAKVAETHPATTSAQASESGMGAAGSGLWPPIAPVVTRNPSPAKMGVHGPGDALGVNSS